MIADRVAGMLENKIISVPYGEILGAEMHIDTALFEPARVMAE